jgi:hypothetical protein
LRKKPNQPRTEIIVTLIAKVVGIASQSEPPGFNFPIKAHLALSNHNIHDPGRKKITQ